jgi:hypothetical protein
VSYGLALLRAGVLTFFFAFFTLADYSWERRKARGLNEQHRPSAFGKQSERREYEWYSWIRYLVIILLTYMNAAAVVDSETREIDLSVSPTRMLWGLSDVLLLSIALFIIDGFWDRRRQRGSGGVEAGVFWSYFWLRYPALILATIAATKHALRP